MCFEMKRLPVLLPLVVLGVVVGFLLFGIGLTPYLFFGCFVASVIFYLRSRKHPMNRSNWTKFATIVGVILGICLIANILPFFLLT